VHVFEISKKEVAGVYRYLVMENCAKWQSG